MRNVGTTSMYRDRESHGDGGGEQWQDWPPEVSPRSEEPGPSPGQVAPSVPADGSELAAPPGARDADAAENGAGATAVGARLPRLRTIALIVGALLVLGFGGWYGSYWWTTGRYLVSTDDAYVGAKNATLSAKIMGYVSAVVVD